MSAGAIPDRGAQTVTERVLALLTKTFGMDVERVTVASSLRLDIGLDSLDEAELLMAVEEDFEISVPDPESAAWRSVLDVVTTVERRLAAKAS